jgi:eukaryotic-like serine/threonine-protein kinase
MIGKVFSQYKIIKEIGHGGMGNVYLAEDTKLNRHVALKFLTPELMRDAEAKERFLREARAASSLDNPNICTIHEINETKDGQLFICMTYYEGESLKDKIKHGPIEPEKLLSLSCKYARD